MNIILLGGGTAGHVMPNIALLPALSKHFDRIFYVGSEKGIERDIAEKNNLPYFFTEVAKFDRSKLFENLKIPFAITKGIKQAIELVDRLHPDVVFAKGGYCSLPIAIAARKRGVPVVCHESDFTLGLANKIICRFADLMITPYKEIKVKCPVEIIGLPIRKKIFEGNAYLLKNKYDIKKPVLLAIGGSSGALRLNKMIYDNLDRLTEKYFVFHIIGKTDKLIERGGYKALRYVDDIENYYALSDVIVTRGGAGVLSEIAALSKRAVIVPLSGKATRGDQLKNANYYRQEMFYPIIDENNYTDKQFLETIEKEYWSTPPKKRGVDNNNKIAESLLRVATKQK